MNEKRVVAYSFLAHVNNSKEGINDLKEVFEPLVENSLAQLVKDGIQRGKISDIKDKMWNIYSIDIPSEVLFQIVKNIEANTHKVHPGEFRIFNDKSFVIDSIAFIDNEQNIEENESDLLFLENLYCEFMSKIINEAPRIEKLYEFLDNNRTEIADLIAGVGELKVYGASEALFVQRVKDIPRAKRTIRRIYLGSIICGYLEVEFGPRRNGKVEYVLDTSFIVQLLGISDEEAEDTAKRIVDICRAHGDSISVLDVTLDETDGLLERLIARYDAAGPVESLSSNTLYGNIVRRKLKRTDLERIKDSYVELIENTYSARVVGISDNITNRVKKGKLYEKMKTRKYNPDGALHDSIVVDYVLSRRGKNVKTFNSSKCWFISEGGYEQYYHGPNGREVSPCIKPGILIGVLWMSSPMVKSLDLIDVGLSRMIAAALRRSLPEERIIREFDDNIKKYMQNEINSEQCVSLARNLAYNSVIDVSEANDQAQQDPDRFRALVNNAVTDAMEYDRKEKEFFQSVEKSIRQEYADKMKKIEQKKIFTVKAVFNRC
jgi:predicted nucleic acid-binding protein